MDVKALSDVALPLVFKKLGPLAGKLLEKVFGAADPSDAVPVDNATGNGSPVVLKKFIQGLVAKFIAGSSLPESLKRVLSQIMARLDGLLLDLLWNALFQKGLVAAPTTSAAANTEIAPLDIPSEADGAFFAEFGEAIPGSGY